MFIMCELTMRAGLVVTRCSERRGFLNRRAVAVVKPHGPTSNEYIGRQGPRQPPSHASRRSQSSVAVLARRFSSVDLVDKKLVLESFGGFPAQLKLKCWCSSWMVCWAELCSVQPWSTQPYTGSNSGLCHGCFVKDIYVSNFLDYNWKLKKLGWNKPIL